MTQIKDEPRVILRGTGAASKPLVVSIVIPVFNEANTIATLLDRVISQGIPGFEKQLVIVESNSKDGSRKIVQDFVAAHEKTADVRAFYQERPRGKGFAVREGFAHATGDIIMIQDADLEYDTEDYTLLLEPIARGHVDVVLGSRHLAAGTWKIREFDRDPLRSFILNMGGIFFHGLFNTVFSSELTDPTTMYKVFRRSCVENMHFECDRFDFDYELLGKLIRAGYMPLEVPVSYKSRGFDEGKKVNALRDPMTWVRAIFKSRISKLYDARHHKSP